MSALGFQPNPLFVKEAEASLFMAPIVKAIADEMMEFAKAIAPDAPPIGAGYIASFETEAGLEGGKVTARLINTSDHARFIEFGTEDTPVFAILHKAAERFGGLKPE